MELNVALTRLGMENLKLEQIQKIGEGAWYTAYKVKSINENLVIRIKKKMAYGELLEINEQELVTEYESTRIY